MTKGYLLMEGLLATMVLGIIVVSLTGSLQSSLSGLQHSKNQTQCLALCEEILENMRRIWTTNPAALNTTNNWVTLTQATTPNLRADPVFFQARYRCRQYNQPLAGTPVVIPGIPPNRLFFVEVDVVPINVAIPPEGIILTSLFGQRGP